MQAPTKKPAKDFNDLFDDDDDGQLMDEGLSDSHSPARKPATRDEDDDDLVIPSTGRVKNRGAILDDENSLGEFWFWCSVVFLFDQRLRRFLYCLALKRSEH